MRCHRAALRSLRCGTSHRGSVPCNMLLKVMVNVRLMLAQLMMVLVLLLSLLLHNSAVCTACLL